MTYQHIARTFGLAVTLLGGMTGEGHAQMFVPTGRDTLRGLPGVEVVVEEPQPELGSSGVSHGAILKEVTERLRASGIPVYASQTENPSPAKAYLYVHVNAVKLASQQVYVVAIQVHLRQTVRSLVSESQIVNAMTWDAHNVISVPIGGLGGVRAEILDYVNLFVSDWTAVH